MNLRVTGKQGGSKDGKSRVFRELSLKNLGLFDESPLGVSTSNPGIISFFFPLKKGKRVESMIVGMSYEIEGERVWKLVRKDRGESNRIW